mgnify:CR=1 FL=1
MQAVVHRHLGLSAPRELDANNAYGFFAPLGDLVGVSRQTAVLAYQFGDGFSNMIVPTNIVLMSILGIAGIPYDRWLRFIWPLLLKLTLAAAVALVVAVQIGYH